MLDTCKSASRHIIWLTRHRIKYPISWNYEKIYFGNTIGAKGGVFDSVITRIRSRWWKFRDSIPLLASRSLLLEAKSETWLVKEKYVIRLKRNDAKIGQWMWNVRPGDGISSEELRIRLKLKSMRECYQDRRLQWFGHLGKMQENAGSIKWRTFKGSGSFPRGLPRKTWNEIIKSDLKEMKVSKDIAKDRNG